jgi:hypothetical protein
VRQLITKIITQVLAIFLLLAASAFWLGIIDWRTNVLFFLVLFPLLLLNYGLRFLIFLPALIIPIFIVLPIVSRLNVLPGVRALIVATIFGTALCIATLFTTNKEANKNNRENHNKAKKQTPL